MARINLILTVTDDDLAQGWAGDIHEFSESVRATLHEVIGDDGMPYMPRLNFTDTDATA